ncbi:protein-disulfide reductase DsbD domain-containing protein [Tepidamorphus sp. 3E244]|uniref:protein-disulfide reductase DsbD domain-containing protein n=1 Tax=Tepidamorphus sp. 3E244 TaxID=3385498 RepID=UPI0038FC4A9F
MTIAKPFLAAAALALVSTVAVADSASDWSQGGYARVRLINAGNPEPGVWRAGLEIDLKDGWKTYWRSPGETGVPPIFDWTPSDGVASVEVHWPTPVRFVDSGLTSIGYKGDVVLPIEIRTTGDTPPKLDLALSYAVCSDICVPEEATVTLDLSGGASPRGRVEVEASLAKVPERTMSGTNIAVARPGKTRQDPIEIELVSGTSPERVFVEGPEDWYLPAPEAATNDGTVTLSLPTGGIPDAADLDGVKLTVTALGPDGAWEETVELTAR